jgi:hypothetical protein
MTGDQLKAAFEAWAGKRGYALDSMTYDDGAVEYHSAETWSLWLGWQAATASHAAEVEALRSALLNLVGTPDDPNAGWRGAGGTNEVYACEYCNQKHGDCTAIPHLPHCPVPAAHAALKE